MSDGGRGRNEALRHSPLDRRRQMLPASDDLHRETIDESCGTIVTSHSSHLPIEFVFRTF